MCVKSFSVVSNEYMILSLDSTNVFVYVKVCVYVVVLTVRMYDVFFEIIVCRCKCRKYFCADFMFPL